MPAGHLVYTAMANERDAVVAGAILYSLKANNQDDEAAFSIEANSGEVRLKASPDYEDAANPDHAYAFTVVATDRAGNTAERPVTLTVRNVDDLPPEFTSASSVSVDENVPADHLVYTAMANERDAVGAPLLTYSLKANNQDDAAAFSIDSNSGEVRIKAGPDYEDPANPDHAYAFTVVATDRAGNTAERPVTLAINDLMDDRPLITAGFLSGVRNLDVRSKIVLDLSDAALTAVAGKTLRIVNDGGTFDHDGEPDTPSQGYQSENARNDILIDVSTGATTIRVDGAATTVLPTSMLKSLVSNTSTVTLDAVNRKLVIDLCVDLDLSNSYHIEIDAGAFTNAAGIGNAAITDAAAMAFSTVRPAEDDGNNNSANREGSLSQAMTPTGLVPSYRWIDLVGRGSVQSDTLVKNHIFDGGAQKYAFAFADIGDIAGIASAEFLTRVFNFGADDLIYIDSQGDGFTVPTATIAATAEQAWTVPVAVDYVTLNASGAGVIGDSALPNRPARTFGKFSLAAGDELGGGGQLRLSLDPALEGLLNPMNSNRDSLDDVAVAPQNIEDFNTKLNGGVAPNLGANGNWLNPENPALYVVLG